ncbi:hypothetical protein OEZ85_002339 [Tetradesmus obliquus]|uniref:Protein kinase domain-containing protein n=1 Tax=Tetradesmus obliquus TaxID=3088 RepID=A0ABY8U2W3_TETOB|nr:hypothetical protein OEZ85_002339 [Tetradesmus obliquus]
MTTLNPAQRDLPLYSKLSAQLGLSALTDVSFLDKPPRLIGAGSYNDLFAVKALGSDMVLRLSYYSSYTLGRVQALIRQHMPYKQLICKAQRITSQDPVAVKNNYSRFCNLLIEQQVCPHYVYMFAFKDVKCFAASVKDQVKPERARNNLAFRYNNVSFHEKYHTSLRLRLRQLTDLQQRVALFQVLFGLAMLQHYLPGFRHNDLSLDNVLIYTYTPVPSACTHYKLPNGTEFWLPCVGVHTAVADFDLAHAAQNVTITTPNGRSKFGLQNQLIAKDQFGNHSDKQARNLNASDNNTFDSYYSLYRLRSALRGSRSNAATTGGVLAQWLSKQSAIKEDIKYLSKPLPIYAPHVLMGNDVLFREFKVPRQATASYQARDLPMLQVQGQSAAVASECIPSPPPLPRGGKATVQKVMQHTQLQRRRAGKSHLMFDLMWHNRDIPVAVVCSASEDGNHAYSKFVPDSFVYSEFSEGVINKVISRQQRVMAANEAASRAGMPQTDSRALLVLDDIGFDPKALRSKPINQLFMNGRHHHIAMWASLQDARMLNPCQRANSDYVFFFRDYINKNRLYDTFFRGIFDTYSTFSQVFDAVTEDYGVLVLDQTCQSSKLEDVVFHYKATLRPAFRFGAPELWRYHESVYKAPSRLTMAEEEAEKLRQSLQGKKSGPVVRVHMTCPGAPDASGQDFHFT